MFLAFGKAMPHEHNKDADGGRDSPTSGHFTAAKPLVGCVGWIVTERMSCFERPYCLVLKRMYCLTGTGTDRLMQQRCG